MRTYQEAQALIGQRLEASSTNGRTKFIRFLGHHDGTVIVKLMGTDIVTFNPGLVTVRTGNFVTPTTFDSIAVALNEPRIVCGTTKRVPHLLGHRMSEGMRLDYAGRLVAAGGQLTPLGPTRGRRGSS